MIMIIEGEIEILTDIDIYTRVIQGIAEQYRYEKEKMQRKIWWRGREREFLEREIKFLERENGGDTW